MTREFALFALHVATVLRTAHAHIATLRDTPAILPRDQGKSEVIVPIAAPAEAERPRRETFRPERSFTGLPRRHSKARRKR